MPTILGELKSACLEVLSSDPTGPTQGRIWYNTTEEKIKFDDGSGIRALLRNDLKLIIGNSGTAASNIRLNRAAAGVLQLILGDDSTAEGSLSTILAQLSSRLENYLDAGKPTFGNAGRLIYVTDLNEIQFDTGSTWNTVGSGVDSASNVGGFTGVFKARVVNDLQFKTLQSSDATLSLTANASDIDIKGPKNNSQTITANGNFTVPDGVTTVKFLGCGGGGGGGGAGGTPLSGGSGGGGGGGGAGILQELIVNVTPGQIIAAVIGSGGAGGAGGTSTTDGSAGSAGSSTTLIGTGVNLVFVGGAGGGGGGFTASNGNAGNASAFLPSIGGVGGTAGGGQSGGGGGGASIGNGAAAGIGGGLGSSATGISAGGGGSGGGSVGSAGSGGRSYYFSSVAAGGASGNGGGGGGGGTAFGVGGAGAAGGNTPAAGSAAAANTGGGGGGGGGRAGGAGPANGSAGGAGGSGQVIAYWVGL